MPFGFCIATATFQRVMDTILCEMLWKTTLVFVDDIIIIGRRKGGNG